MPESGETQSLVSTADLIPDRALRQRDDDAFNHDAIAANLAEHVACAQTPLNIALYGPWGSGKSSAFELLRRRLVKKQVKLVHYDASRYGGEALRRNFISHAASDLDFTDRRKEHRDFHDGLYEGKKSAGVEMPSTAGGIRHLLSPLVPFLLVFLLLLVGVAAVGWGVSYLTDRDVPNQIAALLTGLAVPAGVIAVFVAGIKAALDGATITTEHSRPSADEEFRRRFDDLVAAARKKHDVERIVFFIDELDRCSPDEVVKTLITIKTFLDHEHCVFVVAADRDVLEQALTTHLQQATPYNEENPYYSSASAFLDKVFHHQIFLPPLRKMKLTHFARDLVYDRGGLWQELREFGEQRYVDRVIYALVPSHVVSPRRVKVLLNNFATNVRIIQSRGIEWQPRAPEIAKLTVLQTEFPSLAADLPVEPRLPEFLLEPPQAPSPKLQRVLERHQVDVGVDGDVKQTDDLPVVDPVLPSGDDPQHEATRQRIMGVQNRDLRRYLKRTSGVGILGPGRDLLFLEPVGTPHGLDDYELSEIVEADALESPDNVVAALSDRPEETKRAVVAVLCDMCEGEFGEERANVMSALMGVVGALGTGARPVSVRVIDALNSFQTEQELAARHLPGALQVALSLPTDEGRALATTIVEDGRLLAVPQTTTQAACMLDQMPGDLRGYVVRAVAKHLASDVATLTDPLAALSPQGAESLLGAKEVRSAIVDHCIVLNKDPDEDADGFLDSIYVSALSHGTAAGPMLDQFQQLLLHEELGYAVVRGHAPEVLPLFDGITRDSHALRGLVLGSSDDWSTWSSFLSGTFEDAAHRVRDVAAVVRALIDEAEHESALEVAGRLQPYADHLDESSIDKVVDRLTSALGGRTWWASDAELNTQRRIYEVALALGGLGPPTTLLGKAVASALSVDLGRVDEPTVRPGYGETPSPLASTASAYAGVRVLGAMLARRGEVPLAQRIRELIPSADQAFDAAALRALLVLAAGAQNTGTPVSLGDTAPLVEILGPTVKAAQTAADWLRLDPEPELVAAIAARLDNEVPDFLGHASTEWAARRTADQRTYVVLELVDRAPRHTRWVKHLADEGVDDHAVVRRIRERVAATPRHEDRNCLVELLVTLRPSGRAAHYEVAELMLDLLNRGKRVDFDIALRAAEVLGSDHGHIEKLRSAFDEATRQHGFRIPHKALNALHVAKIRPKQRTVAEDAVEKLKALFRR